MTARRSVSSLGVSCAALTAALAGCPGENVDLGRNVDGSSLAVPSDMVDATVADDASTPPSASIIASTGKLCQGACVELLASASGAEGPYAYEWGQGLGEGAGPKLACPVATTTYSVTVSSTSSEVVGTSSVSITVVACDAGPAESAPGHDAGAHAPPGDSGGNPAPSALCVDDPSFEGTPQVGTSGPPGIPPSAAPPGWSVCLGDPDIDPSVSLLPASDGKTYVGLAVGSGSFSNQTESLGTTLCQGLEAGTTYAFCLDLGIGVQGVMAPQLPAAAPAPALEIWGGTSLCGQTELLWTSPPIDNHDSWMTVCGTFVPAQALDDLLLIPTIASAPAPGAWSYVIIDHLTAGP